MTFRRGQRWRERRTGRILVLSRRTSGNKHWSASAPGSRKSHHIHEGTLAKFYVLMETPFRVPPAESVHHKRQV